MLLPYEESIVLSGDTRMTDLPEVLTVIAINPLDQATADRIEAVAPGRVKVHRVWSDFQAELAEDWPPETMKRWGTSEPPTLNREQLEALIQEAHIAILGVPWLKTAATRMPNLRWAHLPHAGVSNLQESAWWGRHVPLTSARGHTSGIPIAESAMAGVFLLARRLDLAVRQTDARSLDSAAYSGKMRVLRGKTMGVIGLGGIGGEMARIARGVGMRVVGTRNSVTERLLDQDGVDVVFPAAETHALLAESDFVVVCAPWTAKTERLMNADAFSAMKPGACLVNIARGELIDEPALIQALRSGQLAGAYIDVWWQDTDQPPNPELLEAPNLLITPHVSGGSDGNYRGGIDLFCENLARFLRSEELINVVEWERGY
jgi:phosphoglycerate dehydrogenase-like enzyme